MSRIRWNKTHERSTEEKEDAGMDAAENTTLTAEMLANITETTRVLEDVQLELLEDAKRVEESAEQATSPPSILRDQIAGCIAMEGSNNSETEALPETKEEA